jgi:MarR family transcriptional regulator, negative regulator of the multidrug operon emrRAB
MYPPGARRKPVPDDDDHLANVLGALSTAVNDAMTAAIEDATGLSGVAPAALIALHDLLAGRTVDDLRRAVDLTHSGAVRVVDRLVADGLAARRAGVDARSLAVVLTARGQRVARAALDARAAVLHDALDGLDARERQQLTRLVEQVVTTVVEHRLAARRAGDDPAGGWLCRQCDPVGCGRPHGRCPAATAATAATP